MTIEPVTLVEASAATWAGLRLAYGGAEWLVLYGRAQLVRAVTSLPPGTRLTGRGWEVRVPAGQEPR
ncbi:MAG TPA: hypothetical protein VJT31_35030 [Rugosimonospora sp.]|nr:hypothetical protein [Rugosimonospora sp.]